MKESRSELHVPCEALDKSFPEAFWTTWTSWKGYFIFITRQEGYEESETQGCGMQQSSQAGIETFAKTTENKSYSGWIIILAWASD